MGRYPTQFLGIQRPSELSPPPPPNPADPVQPVPPPPESARWTQACQRNGQRHGDSEPRCADERVGVPREQMHSCSIRPLRKSRVRPGVFRTLPFLKTWFCLLLVLSSPGSKGRTDATMSCHDTQGPKRHDSYSRIAPGDLSVEHHDQLVPLLRCSEHAMQSTQSSRMHQDDRSSQRGSSTHRCQEGRACQSPNSELPCPTCLLSRC